MSQKILYSLNPGNNISPFDVTIAADAGFDQILPLTNIQPECVTAMVQDAIFSRPPKRFNDTGIFIGGRDVHLAADMFQNAKKAMVGDRLRSACLLIRMALILLQQVFFPWFKKRWKITITVVYKGVPWQFSVPAPWVCVPLFWLQKRAHFIGGRDVHLAADMFQNAKKAMVGDFEVGVFADPNGAYTTSASVLSLVQKTLEDNHNSSLQGRTVAVFGTGPVGLCSAVLAAKEGATTRLCGLTADDDEHVAARFCERYQANVDWISALTHEEKVAALKGVDVVICVAKAGIRILEMEELNTANNLLVVADTNAVPPSGVAGVGMQDLNVPIEYSGGTFSAIGPLAIGNIKYKTEMGLFKYMQESEKAALIDFPEAYEYALAMVKKLPD